MHWRDRAQANKYAVCPLVIVTRGWKYDINYRLGADLDMEILQDWLYHQIGATWRTVPAVRIDSWKKETEHAAGNIYLDIAAQVGQDIPRYDRGGERVDFCNPKRLYALYATGQSNLANMGGRQAFGCEPRTDNPLEPWGPGRAGGPSAWAMELTAEHPVDAPQTRNVVRGALLHEMLHCLGIQHPTEEEDGPEAWLSPMAGYWFFGVGDPQGRPAALLEREKQQLRESHFFA